MNIRSFMATKTSSKLSKVVFILGFILLSSLNFTHAQDSSRLRISLLTCAPGDELYSIFGHSALRVTDSNSVTDIVFNYGTFNFDEDDFYVKFMRGKLKYFLSTVNFNDFRFAYMDEKRAIQEQILNLTPAEKISIKNALIENLQEDKKYYLYDFFLDNCTTRLRDLLLKYKNPSPMLPAVMPIETSFRNAIHQYLDKGHKPWSKLGIDILLGAKTDAVMTVAQQDFLPNNLMMAIENCQNSRLVLSRNDYKVNHSENFNEEWLTPLKFFSFLLLLQLILNFTKMKFGPTFAEGLGNFLLFLTGLLGCILVIMWFGTDHKMTKDNYNLFWAWPFHLIFVFVNRKIGWVRKYFQLNTVFLCLTLAAWAFLPQKLNPALIPFVLLLVFESYKRGFKSK